MSFLSRRAIVPGRTVRPCAAPRHVVRAASGRPEEPFNENVAQVKRLISRDRKEFLGNDDDILDKYNTEFGGEEQPASFDAAAAAAAAAKPVAAATATQQPAAAEAARPSKPAPSFGGANPFASGATATPFKKKGTSSPKGLTPDMSPDPIVPETPASLLSQIGLPQILIFLSFSLIIGLMVSTFFVVVQAGGVRLAGLD